MSGPRFLLDTNIVIGYLDGLEPVRSLIGQHQATPQNSAISQITRIELLSFSALTDQDEARIHTLLNSMTIIPLDDRIERETIALRRRFRLKLPDAIIGATAIAHELKLLSLDDRLNAAQAML